MKRSSVTPSQAILSINSVGEYISKEALEGEKFDSNFISEDNNNFIEKKIKSIEEKEILSEEMSLNQHKLQKGITESVKMRNELKKEDNKVQRNKYCDYYRLLASSQSDDNYFKEDLKSRKAQELKDEQANKSSIKHFFEQFRFSFFFEFFLLHVLYFIILGPLSIPIINLRGKALSRNLSFTGMSRSAIIQFIFFALNTISLFIYVFMDCPSIHFSVEIVNLISVTITRCFLIACKYATYDPVSIKVLRTTILTLEQKNSQLFLQEWIFQSPKIIYNQVYQCQRAFDIDPSLFFVQFMVDPETKTHERLSEHDQILLKIRSNEVSCEMKPIPVSKEKKGQIFYFGFAILKDLIDTFQEQNKGYRKIVLAIGIFFTFSRAFVPVVTLLVTNNDFLYKYPHEYFIGVLSLCQVIFTYLIFTSQCAYGLFDVQRKLFMQRQLSFMISPRKLKNLDMVKTLPTINIFNSGTMKGWTLIRKVCMEYGKGYSLRIQGIFTYLGIWIVLQLLCIILYYFKKIILDPAFEYQAYLDISFSIILIFALIFSGAQINDVFELQESILNSNRTIISDLSIVVSSFHNQTYSSQSYIYTKALEKISEYNQDSPQEYIDQLLRHYEFHLQELLFDKDHNPFKLFGIKVTFLMLQSAAVALGSVVATLLTQIKSLKSG